MEEDNSVYRSVVIFLLSICVISLALGIYANYRLIVISRENQKQRELNKKKKAQEELVEITNKYTLDLIENNQVVLKNYTDEDYTNKKARIYESNITNKELQEDKKIVSVLYSLFEKDKYEELDKDKYPNITPNQDGATYIINIDDVKNVYKNLYGGKINTETELPEAVRNSFYYNKEYDVYVVNAGFGGACVENILTYDYKYMEDSSKVYVYSAMAYEANCPYGIYKDFNKKEKYETEDSFELNENNYKDFNNYIITYKKNGDNYIFDSIEKIK